MHARIAIGLRRLCCLAALTVAASGNAVAQMSVDNWLADSTVDPQGSQMLTLRRAAGGIEQVAIDCRSSQATISLNLDLGATTGNRAAARLQIALDAAAFEFAADTLQLEAGAARAALDIAGDNAFWSAFRGAGQMQYTLAGNQPMTVALPRDKQLFAMFFDQCAFLQQAHRQSLASQPQPPQPPQMPAPVPVPAPVPSQMPPPGAPLPPALATGGPQGFYPTSFDCGARLNASERAICGDPQIASLDVQMAALYRGLGPTLDSPLRAAQIRWQKQRNSCGADPGCLQNAYGQRIGELAAMTATPPMTAPADAAAVPDVTVGYFCPASGQQFQVRYENNTEPNRAVLIIAGMADIALDITVSGSGVRYSDGNVTWHTKGRDGLLSQSGHEIVCSERP